MLPDFPTEEEQGAAQFTSSIVEDVLVHQGRPAVDSVLGEEPAEKLHARRGEVAPDEVVGGALVVTAG